MRIWENMTIQSFRLLSTKSCRILGHCLSCKCNEIRREWQLREIAKEATNYIHDIVWHFLDKEPADLDYLRYYLRCVRDACQDAEISSLDLFTLNHDIVIERYLEECGIEYTDGFEPPVNGVRYWSRKVLERPCYNVRLLKLHGSVNWFLFESHGVGIAVDGLHWAPKDRHGQSQRAVAESSHAASRYSQQNA